MRFWGGETARRSRCFLSRPGLFRARVASGPGLGVSLPMSTRAARDAVLKPVPSAEPRSVTILGSTGSVGRNTVDLIRRQPADYRIEALTGSDNVALLAEQARLLKPKL